MENSYKGVQFTADLKGSILEVNAKQQFINKSNKTKEVVYTFPLPAKAEVSFMNLKIGDKSLSGKVMKKSDGQMEYVESLEKGDQPVLLERNGNLFTISIGTIGFLEKVEIDIKFSMIIDIRNNNSSRISIPTTYGVRYGNTNLEPYADTGHEFLSEYKFNLSLSLDDFWSKAKLNCKTHSLIKSEKGMSFEINESDMDSDIVINISNFNFQGSVNYIQDSSQEVQMLMQFPSIENTENDLKDIHFFVPNIENTKNDLKDIHFLCDCSGSMAGERIQSVKEALSYIIANLNKEDKVNITLFGSDSKKLFDNSLSLNEKNLNHIQNSINKIDADYGGTETKQAIVSTLKDNPKDIVLFTDGDIWDEEGLIDIVQKTESRIFVVGIGSAINQGVLDQIAEVTAASSHFISNISGIDLVCSELLDNINQGSSVIKNINFFGEDPIWSSYIPKNMPAGSSFVCSFGFKNKPKVLPEIILGMEKGLKVKDLDTKLKIKSQFENNINVSKLINSLRIKNLKESDLKQRIDLALKYEILTSDTCFYLLNERDEKLTNGSIEQVPNMLPKDAVFSQAFQPNDVIMHSYSPEPFKECLESKIEFNEFDLDLELMSFIQSKVTDKASFKKMVKSREFLKLFKTYFKEYNQVLNQYSLSDYSAWAIIIKLNFNNINQVIDEILTSLVNKDILNDLSDKTVNY